MKLRESAAPIIVVLALCGITFVVYGMSSESASFPGWIMMGLALAGLIYVFDLPRTAQDSPELRGMVDNIAAALARHDYDKAEELLHAAKRKIGPGTSQLHIRMDLAEGTLLFRQGLYEAAFLSLERCFLNAFAIEDRKYGAECGVLLLKTLVAMGRYRDACEFAMGVRALTSSPEIEDLVVLASNRMQSATMA